MENIPQAQLDPKTGMVTYRGDIMTYREWLTLVDEEWNERQEIWNEQRDYSSDLQNLWGNKKNGFKDDWFRRKRPLRRRPGYPSEVEYRQ